MPATSTQRLTQRSSFFPFSPPQLHAISIPAGIFTGDFFFWSPMGDSLLFALGDVAGKGIHAAVYMAMIQEELEGMAACEESERIPLPSLVERLHATLRNEMAINRFVSLVVGTLDSAGVMNVVNAGHWAPLVLHPDGRIDTVQSTGPVIGMLPRPKWCSQSVPLQPGDIVILYTDGVVEAESPCEEQFGFPRVQEVVSACRGTGAKRVAVGLLKAVESHRGSLGRQDDVTIMAFEMNR